MESQTPSELPPWGEAVIRCPVSVRDSKSRHAFITGESPTFLKKDNTCKSIVEIPKVNTAHAAFVIQIAIDIEGLVRLNFHLANTLAWDCTLACAFVSTSANATRASLIQGRVKLVGPWRAVAVAIAIVVAKEVVSASLLAAAHGKGLVDGRKEIFGQVRGDGDDGVEMVGCLLGIETAQEVATDETVSYKGKTSLRERQREGEAYRAESKGSTAIVADCCVVLLWPSRSC